MNVRACVWLVTGDSPQDLNPQCGSADSGSTHDGWGLSSFLYYAKPDRGP